MRTMMISAAALLIAGCGAKATPSNDMGGNGAATLNHAALVGPWATASVDCELGGGLILNADGEYNAIGENGRWRLKGNMLSFTPTETYDASFDDSPTPIRNPQTLTHTVTEWTGKTMTLRSTGGSAQKFKKC